MARNPILVSIADFQIVAKHLVEAQLKAGNTASLPLLLQHSIEKLFGICGQESQIIQLL